MMKTNFKLLIGCIALAGISVETFGQNEIDALRYSQTQVMGTARSLGLGNAVGAVGGDMSALSINPASIGVYRKSEFGITPNLKLNNVNASYFGNATSNAGSKFSINNFGFVLATPARGRDYESKAWKSVAVGLTYNKLADFNQEALYQGVNSESSMTEVFAEDGFQFGLSENIAPPFGFLGYQGYLFDDNFASYAYNDIILNGGSLLQEKYWKNTGNIQEWGFSFGGNYKEKLMLGGSANLLSYRFNSFKSYYEEDNTGNRNNNFDYVIFNDYLTTSGFGFNLKLGALYHVTPDIRIGATVHTPTWSSFTDEQDFKLESETEGVRAANGAVGTKSVITPQNSFLFDYSLRTPWKFGLNAMSFLGQYGFVSLDYELTDYSSMKYNMGANFSQQAQLVNTQIGETFRASHNIRLGVEARFNNYLARAGFGHITSPYQNSEQFGGSRSNISLGAGVNLKSFSINLAYVYTMQPYKEYGYPITYGNIPVGLASVKDNFSLLALSLTFKM